MAYNKPPKITGFMPRSMHKDDAQWIFSKLSLLPSNPSNKEIEQYTGGGAPKSHREKVCDAYTNAFDDAFDIEPLSHRKTGKARYAANNRLRIYIGKKFAVFNK